MMHVAFNWRPLLLFIAIVVALSLSGCAARTYRYDNGPQTQIEQRAVTQVKGAFAVSASVPSTEESTALFGIPLHKRGIQAVWLHITNNGATRARFAPYSVDPEYFPPYEVAYMHKKSVSKDELPAMERYLDSISIPRTLPPGKTVSGYLFTHSDPGTKAFNVDIHYTDGESSNESFTFFVDVPGFVPDYYAVDFKGLYAPTAIRELNVDQFRKVLESDWPCCTVNHDGSRQGRPVNVVFIADGIELRQALLRAGWTETSLDKGDNYLISIDHYFNRPPDAMVRKKREFGTERNEMALWLTPMLVDGKRVWVAQVKHAIGRLFEIGEFFFGIRLDPDSDEGRNYALQDLWYAQSLKAFAWSRAGRVVPKNAPEFDFNGNPWYSDGLISVQWLSGEPVSIKSAQVIEWDRYFDGGGRAE